MSTPTASIVIPTHNGATRLPLPLEALARQSAPAGTFEVLVVDNCSTDDTSRVAETLPATTALRQRGTACRVVGEQQQRLLHARIRGVQEARGQFVCFLDDDNVPGPDYVAEALEGFNDPSVGVLISRVFPHYVAGGAPASVVRRENLLAINYRLGEDVIHFG